MPVTGTLELESSASTVARLLRRRRRQPIRPDGPAAPSAASSTPAAAVALASASVTGPAAVATASRPPTMPPGQERQDAVPSQTTTLAVLQPVLAAANAGAGKDQRAGAAVAPSRKPDPETRAPSPASRRPLSRTQWSAGGREQDRFRGERARVGKPSLPRANRDPRPQTRTKRGGRGRRPDSTHRRTRRNLRDDRPAVLRVRGL